MTEEEVVRGAVAAWNAGGTAAAARALQVFHDEDSLSEATRDCR
jgi:hypothetical protein